MATSPAEGIAGRTYLAAVRDGRATTGGVTAGVFGAPSVDGLMAVRQHDGIDCSTRCVTIQTRSNTYRARMLGSAVSTSGAGSSCPKRSYHRRMDGAAWATVSGQPHSPIAAHDVRLLGQRVLSARGGARRGAAQPAASLRTRLGHEGVHWQGHRPRRRVRPDRGRRPGRTPTPRRPGRSAAGGSVDLNMATMATMTHSRLGIGTIAPKRHRRWSRSSAARLQLPRWRASIWTSRPTLGPWSHRSVGVDDASGL